MPSQVPIPCGSGGISYQVMIRAGEAVGGSSSLTGGAVRERVTASPAAPAMMISSAAITCQIPRKALSRPSSTRGISHSRCAAPARPSSAVRHALATISSP